MPNGWWPCPPKTTHLAPRVIAVEGLCDLYRVLVAEGYRMIGPAVQDGAIVLRELSSAAELPFGWGVWLEPGGYQLRRRDDPAAFGHAAGPQSWKRFLHPPRERLWSAARTPDGGFELSDEADDGAPPSYAFLAVRPCDLRAIAIQDRVLAQPGSRYAARRARLLIVAVNGGRAPDGHLRWVYRRAGQRLRVRHRRPGPAGSAQLAADLLATPPSSSSGVPRSSTPTPATSYTFHTIGG